MNDEVTGAEFKPSFSTLKTPLVSFSFSKSIYEYKESLNIKPFLRKERGETLRPFL